MQFEVNRYLGWPGQAPSYKVGQRIWEQLRDEVAEREGAAFSIKRSTSARSTSAASASTRCAWRCQLTAPSRTLGRLRVRRVGR